jgi:hypothetical protein
MVLFGKTKAASEYVKFANMFLLLQAVLRQNIMIDSGSRLCDVWPMNCCWVARGDFLLQIIQTGYVNHPASYSQDTEASVIGGKMKIAWSWPQTDKQCEKKNMWSCFSNPHVSCCCAQGQLYLLLLLISCTSKLVCQLTGIRWRTKDFSECANKLWAVFVPFSWCC